MRQKHSVPSASPSRAKSFVCSDQNKYIAFNKPYEILCQFTRPDDSTKRCLDEFGFPPNVYPIGRLDYDSEGLLLLSDDGRLNSALLDPAHRHPRTYLAQVERAPEKEALEHLRKGVLIEGRKTLPAQVQLLSEEPELWERSVPIRFRKSVPTSWLELTLTEGRNRQVRKMTAATGHPTLRLVRVSIGKLRLSDLDLSPGQWKELEPNEVSLAFA